MKPNWKRLDNPPHKSLKELGKGFFFVAQQHVITDTSDFFIDLVFTIIC